MRPFPNILLVYAYLIHPQEDASASVCPPASTLVRLSPEVTSLLQGVLEVGEDVALDAVDDDGTRSLQITCTVRERSVLALNIDDSPAGQKPALHHAVARSGQNLQ